MAWLWFSALIVALDQLSKYAASTWLEFNQPLPLTGFFNLTLAHNYGAAFSFLAGGGGWQRWLLLLLAAVVSVVLVIWLIRLPPGQRWLSAGLALVLGGAVGNLIDRALFGYVIDFLDFHHPALAGWPGFSPTGHWPIFNVADSAITVGAIILLIDALFGGGSQPRRSQPRRSQPRRPAPNPNKDRTDADKIG